MHPLEKLLLELAVKEPAKHLAEFEKTVQAILALQAQAQGPQQGEDKDIPSLNPLEKGHTPLMLAAARGFRPYIQLLLDNHVNPCAEYKENSALKQAHLLANVSGFSQDTETLKIIEQAYLDRFTQHGANGEYGRITAILKTHAAIFLPPELFIRGIQIAMQDPLLETFEDKIYFALNILSKKTQDKKLLSNFVVEEFKAANINDRDILKLNWEMIKNSDRIKGIFKQSAAKTAFSLGPSPWVGLTNQLDTIYKQKDILLQNREPVSQTVKDRRESKSDNRI